MAMASTPKSKPKPTPPPASPRSRSIGAALAGLDRADRARRDGRSSEALALYEEHLGTLIGRMKSGAPDGDDGSALRDRVEAALSDAETIKRRLSGPGRPLVGPGEFKRTRSSPSSKLSSAVSSLFGLAGSRGDCADRSQSRKDYDLAHAEAMRRSSPSLRTEQPGPSTQRGRPIPDSPTVGGKKQSSLSYAADDPLVEAVKAELYVDKSRLTTRWDDVVGLAPAKRALQEAAILPMIRPDLYTGLRSPPKGVLLYGPPGTGKTMLVRAAARESKCILFSCTASALTSKWHGEGEKLLRTLFAVALDAAPSTIFFDEIDALLSTRRGGGDEHEASRRFKTEFMVQMDGGDAGSAAAGGDASRRVLVLGCTNCPWDVDDAVMRRFQRRIYVPLPDGEARRFLLSKLLAKETGRHCLREKEIESIVDRTDMFSCSDIAAIAQDAAFGPLRALGGMSEVETCNPEDVRMIDKDDFDEALANAKRSVSSVMMKKYTDWEDQQGISSVLGAHSRV